MGSSEVLDSSGKRANFPVSFSFLDLDFDYLGFVSVFRSMLILAFETVVPTGMMNLLPMIEKSDQNQAPPNLNSPLNMVRHLVGGGGRVETMKKSEIR
ncbi:hypothetical protein F511_41950 [Dorcoceras hygrometricum]|uniref:Uncharacterized protein n=1 Tax=Dorcoceras hygrometricum TaxID=472368 RepID=A0A2Z7BIL8_9LAMI|nr:hypothetical protein F511_41950 [Dorcoceras hygrometricum]